MNISWLGHSCFKISKKIDGREVILVTDPYSKETGLFPPKIKADIVSISHHHFDHDYIDKITGNNEDQLIILDRAGEYEVKKVFINGFDSFHDKKQGAEHGLNIIFKFTIDDICIVHLGDLGEKPNEKLIDNINDVDILMVPVGGKYTLDGAEAAEVVRQIEPRIVIPMHYKVKGLKIDISDETKFIKAMGTESEQLSKLRISRKDLPEDTTKIIVLNKE